eukprot:gnl/MRDRNA2_/MRDRNA2_69903_c0_seq1.p1 gnl/MRDRNA2_/MRDRNA2_69903_c0~~gnl/MRDRNA2_/MRDRNA2_69903_c0_seq1.p1  ORF type:complete len:127 (+),score=16.31 gnl/MRDRNA2_/MRDRNA2_69903_c0_seq1:56-382(+)
MTAMNSVHCGVLVLVAISLFGCHDGGDCPEACGEYDQADGKVDAASEQVCLMRPDDGSLPVCHAVVNDECGVSGCRSVCKQKNRIFDSFEKRVLLCNQKPATQSEIVE